MNKPSEQIIELLEQLYDKYNCTDFIEHDPISIPHKFEGRDDREIAGFLVSTIAWGNRKAIVKSGERMMLYMDNAPADFVLNGSDKEISTLQSYVHRTFNGGDFIDFVRAIRSIHQRFGGIGKFFESHYTQHANIALALSDFRKEFLSIDHNPHCQKHISSIDKGAACKRLNMYLRWMVRSDNRGVDFGMWQAIPNSALYIPLDLHTGNMARALGLLERKQNDWKATDQLTQTLREFDIDDPVRYDFALFGAGIDGFLK